MLAVFVLLEAALHVITQRMGKVAELSMDGRLARGVLVVSFFFLAPVLHIIFNVFACVQLDRPVSLPYTAAAVGSWWVLDTSQQCFAGWHAQWTYGLGLPLVIICILLPLSVALLMLHKRRNSLLSNPWTVAHWGFLYRSYCTQCCYWETVVLLQTILLVAISTFGVTLAPWYQSICMTAALAVMALLLVAAQPHAQPVCRAVALQSICCLFFTTVAGMSFLSMPAGPEPGYVYKEVMGAALLLLHAVFVALVLQAVLKGVHWRGICLECAVLFRRLRLHLICACCGPCLSTSLSDADKDAANQHGRAAGLRVEAACTTQPARADVPSVQWAAMGVSLRLSLQLTDKQR
jgi:hypothetical protein